jgi:esterase/lipase superfamily enzyme
MSDSGTISLPFGDNASSNVFARLYRSLGEGGIYSVLLLLAGTLIFVAAWPLLQDTFTFRQLFSSRIVLAAAAVPLGAAFAFYTESRFNLHRFRINTPLGFSVDWTGRPIRFLLFSLLLGVPLYIFDPIGVYAASDSKAIIPLFYVTNRATTPGPSADSVVFTTELSDPEALTYGLAAVPLRWSREEISRHLRSDVKLSRRALSLTLQNLTRDDFLNQVERKVMASDRHDAFLLVHGFKSPLDKAMNSTAKLSYDLKFQGAAILFSWPSGDDVSSYDHEYELASLSAQDLKGVLLEVAQLPNLKNFHLIAHSMGTRVLGEAIALLDDQKAPMPISENVVLAAPDIGESEFVRESDALRHSARRVTLYVSQWDGALRLSSGLHKGDRVGLNPVFRNGMDTIDTNGIDTSLLDLKHSYLFDSQPVLYDLFQLMQTDLDPNRRVGIYRDQGACCWSFEHR